MLLAILALSAGGVAVAEGAIQGEFPQLLCWRPRAGGVGAAGGS